MYYKDMTKFYFCSDSTKNVYVRWLDNEGVVLKSVVLLFLN